MVTIGPLVFILVNTGFACLLFVRGVLRLPNVVHLRRHDARSISDLRSASGPIKIQGRAVEGTEGTVTPPLSRSPCLLYTYEVEERPGRGGGRYWKTVDEGMGGVDLIVDDGTGRVRVDPTDAVVSLDGYAKTVKPEEELPERFAEHVARTPGLEPQDGSRLRYLWGGFSGNIQRFSERRLEVGDDVSVYGQVTGGNETGWGTDQVDAVVGDGRETPMFVISDRGTVGTAWRLARSGLVNLLAGVLFLFFAFLGVLVLLAF